MSNTFDLRDFTPPALREVIEYLQARGHQVGLTGDIPGLFQVDGREVTTNQLFSIAMQYGKL